MSSPSCSEEQPGSPAWTPCQRSSPDVCRKHQTFQRCSSHWAEQRKALWVKVSQTEAVASLLVFTWSQTVCFLGFLSVCLWRSGSSSDTPRSDDSSQRSAAAEPAWRTENSRSEFWGRSNMTSQRWFNLCLLRETSVKWSWTSLSLNQSHLKLLLNRVENRPV